MLVKDTDTMPATELTLYGKWVAPTHTVTVMNGTEPLGTVTVSHGSYLTADQLAQFQGRVDGFLKWTVDGQELPGEGIPVERDLTVYAYTASSKTTVRYELDGGTGATLPKDGSFAKGTAYSVASGAGLTKVVGGKTMIFSHWTGPERELPDGTKSTVYNQGDTIIIGMANITLTAQYIDPDEQKAELTEVDVVYKNYNGSDVGTVKVTNNVEFNVLGKAPTQPTAPGDGYTFVGWKDANENLYTRENAIARANGENSNVLTAQWTATVTVTGNSETKIYSGSEQTSKAYTVTSNPAGVTVTQADGVVGAKGTDVNTYTQELTAEDFTVTGNPENTTVTVTVEGNYTLVIDPAVIESVAVQVTAPVAGNNPDNSAIVAGDANYTDGTVTWTPANGTFGNGTAYTATVTLTADANYTFAEGVTGKVNEKPATSVTKNENGTVTVTYTFPETQVTITTSIDNGGTITETANYDYGSKATVSWTPAANYHVTKVTVDGVELENPALAGGSYTFEEIAGDHSVVVETAIDTYTVTFKNGECQRQ